MAFFNNNADTNIQSSFDDDNDDAKEKRFLDDLRHIDFFAAPVVLGGDKSRFSDPKAGNNAEYMRKKARQFIQNSREKSFAFWQVFEAVYGADLELDGWANIVHFDDKATTRGMLIGRLEKALQMSSPQATKGFYERQLVVCQANFAMLNLDINAPFFGEHLWFENPNKH
ncbi:hypothetical protein [Nostoc punctiforme]|uniref:hypothetical protein n=1 Tax=Nostoc punctiforme TaxID=272131 RepID=UPI000038D5F6|nr:hypothetical protein [Nostoc punctiforme]